jgi:hypothetical protein
MLPTVLVWALMLWLGQAVNLPACLDKDMHPVSCVPFDVPPVKMETRMEAVTSFSIPEYPIPQVIYDDPKTYSGPHYFLSTNKCVDKTRFLLQSEDGKWHCLALGAKP